MKRYGSIARKIIEEIFTQKEINQRSEYRTLLDCAIRCANYECTGLEPEEIIDVLKNLEPITFSRFRQIIEAEREGRCVLLPCQVGDIVYVIAKCELVRTHLDGTYYGAGGGPGTATGFYCSFDGREEECPLSGENECDQESYAVFEQKVINVGAAYNENTNKMETFVTVEDLVGFLNGEIFYTREVAEERLKLIRGGKEK